MSISAKQSEVIDIIDSDDEPIADRILLKQPASSKASVDLTTDLLTPTSTHFRNSRMQPIHSPPLVRTRRASPPPLQVDTPPRTPPSKKNRDRSRSRKRKRSSPAPSSATVNAILPSTLPTNTRAVNKTAHAKSSTAPAVKSSPQPELKRSKSLAESSCPICLCPFQEPTTTKCGHVYCHDCIQRQIQVNRQCAVCRRKLTAKQLTRLYI